MTPPDPVPTARPKRAPSPLRDPKIRRLNHLRPDQMTEEEAYAFFVKHIFAANDGKPFCPRKECKRCDAIYTYKPRWTPDRTTFRVIYKCKNCNKQFTATSNTPLAYKKISFKEMLCLIWDFTAGVATGTAALRMSNARDHDYKVAWAFFHRLRQAMKRDLESVVLDGEVEIDGTEIGGYVKPKNARKEKHPKDPARTKKNAYRLKNFGSNKCTVFVAIQRNGVVRTTIVKEETEAKPWLRSILSKDATLYADLASDFDDLAWHLNDPDNFKRINHSENFWTPECHTNNAENFNSLLEHMQGVHRRISHPKFRHSYSEELAWRVTNNKLTTGEKLGALIHAIGSAGKFEHRNLWHKKPTEALAA